MSDLGKNWKGHYPGNYTGNLWASYNIDLEKYPGRLTLADKFRRFSSGLGVVFKFIRTNATATDQWFGIVHGTDIIRNGNSVITGGTWATDDTTGTFNDPRDMVVHEAANGEQRLLCSRATDIAILNSSGSANVWDDNWYTAVAGASALTSSTWHPMARLQRLVAVGDIVSNVAAVHTIDSSDTVVESALTFPQGYTIRHIITSSNRFWFLLQHDFDGPGRIIEWDGSSATYNNEYDIIGSYPLTGFVVRDVPYIIDEKGFLYRYSGGSFDVVQSFYLDEQRMLFLSGFTAEYTILPYGVWVDGDLVYINVGIPMVLTTADAETLTLGVRRARSGVWIYNTRNNNLYHHMAYGEHASVGTDVNYGNGYVDIPGAVIKAKNSDLELFVCSGSVFTGGATWLASTTNGIYTRSKAEDRSSNTGRNRGYFITPYIPIKEVEAQWQSLWVKFKTLVDATDDKIVVKWRTTEPLYNESAQDPNANINPLFNAGGTWASTTTFTCKVPTGVTAGDEVEILTGDNAGCSFNISSLSGTPDNTTSLTVTIDEAAPTSSTDTFLCRFDNWNTESAITSSDGGSKYVPFSSNGDGEFIQLKIELRGFDIQIDELEPIFKTLTAKEQG